ncbi:hypothetical protein L6452_01358 [Arctium lappa]|uniref:Uncharacterized protein n=1 Tax=Arctium lappa TaxID=4217 RepID=A0ACB9FHX2_ARCLA|nr:hypothetical protein L6452_01358 [Arctium lappa]
MVAAVELSENIKPSPEKKKTTGDNYSESPEYHHEVEQLPKGGCYVSNQIPREDVVVPEDKACDGKLVNEDGIMNLGGSDKDCGISKHKLKVLNSGGTIKNCVNEEVGLMLNEKEGLSGPPKPDPKQKE